MNSFNYLTPAVVRLLSPKDYFRIKVSNDLFYLTSLLFHGLLFCERQFKQSSLPTTIRYRSEDKVSSRQVQSGWKEIIFLPTDFLND